MTTLTEINETLLAQNSNLEKIAKGSEATGDSVNSLVAKISSQMEKSELQNLKEKNKPVKIGTGTIGTRMTQSLKQGYQNSPDGLLSGLLRGLGLSGAAGLSAGIGATLMTLLSKGLGIIGKGAGRLLRTGLLLGAVNAWGDDLVNWVSNNMLSEPLSEEDKKKAFDSLKISAVAAGLGLGIVKSLLVGALTYMFPEQTAAVGGWLSDGMVSLLGTLGFETEWYNNLDNGMKNQINMAIGGLVGAVVLQMALSLTGKKILIPLAGIIAAKAWDSIKSLPGLLKGGIDDATPPATTPKPGASRPTGGRSNPARATRAASKRAAKAAAQAAEGAAELARFGNQARLNKLGMTRNATGAVVDATTKKFKSVDDIAEAIMAQKAAKAAKYMKFLKVVGPLGALVDLTDPLMAIYNDEPADVIKKELAGALGSVSGAYLGAIGGAAATTLIPVIGQSGIGNILGGLVGAVAGSFAGEYTAESLANFLLGGAQPKPVRSLEESYSEYGAQLATGQQYVPPPGPNDIASYSQYMQPAATPTTPAPVTPSKPKVTPTRGLSAATAGVMAMDYNKGISENDAAQIAAYLAEIAANSGGKGSGGGGTSVSNNAIIMPPASTNDHLDGGFATRPRRNPHN